MYRRYAKSKYGNIKTEVDGIKFDSKKEANRYQELKLLKRAGEIEKLKLQPRYELQPKYRINGRNVRNLEYKADFEYIDRKTGETITEDVKGMKTAVYKIKKKLFEYIYNREIKEI